MAGAAAAARAQVGAVVEAAALRRALAAPAAGEVEHLVGARGSGRMARSADDVERHGVVARVGHRGVDAEHAVVVEGVPQLEAYAVGELARVTSWRPRTRR